MRRGAGIRGFSSEDDTLGSSVYFRPLAQVASAADGRGSTCGIIFHQIFERFLEEIPEFGHPGPNRAGDEGRQCGNRGTTGRHL